MSRHGFWLVLALVVVTASIVLDTDPSTVSFFGWELPPLCTFKRLTGWDCPGCGLTRSFAYMGELSLLDAFRMHWLGPLLWTAVASQIPYRLIRLWREHRSAP